MEVPEDTQPMDTQVWEHMGYSRAGDHTYQVGDTGHVDLLETDLHVLPSAPPNIPSQTQRSMRSNSNESNASGGTCANATQPNRPDTVTSPAAFSPTTPGVFAGAKRDRRGNLLSSVSRTPVPDLAAMFNNTGDVIGLSQLFRQTQARSSPPILEMPVDTIFERPSPDFKHPERAESESPFATRSTLDQYRKAIGIGPPTSKDPKDYYVSLKESQESRDRRNLVQPQLSSLSDNDNDDHRESWIDPMRQRNAARKKQDVRLERAREETMRVTTPMLPIVGQSRHVQLESIATEVGDIGFITPASRHKNQVNLISDELVESQIPLDGSNDDYDELSQEVVTRHIRRPSSESSHTLKRPSKHIPVATHTSGPVGRKSTTKAIQDGINKILETPIRSETGHQVVATQSERDTSPNGSNTRPSQEEKIADSQPACEDKNLSERPSTKSQLASVPGKDITELLEATPLLQTTTSLADPSRNFDSADELENDDVLQTESQLSDLPSSPPSIESANCIGGRSAKSRISSQVSKASSEIRLVNTESFEPMQNFRVTNRLRYAVPETSPSVDCRSQDEELGKAQISTPRSSKRARSQNSMSVAEVNNFHTAREQQTASPMRLPPSRKSVRASDASTQVNNIRRLGDFEDETGPSVGSLEVDIGLNTLDSRDVNIHAAIENQKRRHSNRIHQTSTRFSLEESTAEANLLPAPSSPLTSLQDVALVQDRNEFADYDVFETSTPQNSKKAKKPGTLKGPTRGKRKLSLPTRHHEHAGLSTVTVAQANGSVTSQVKRVCTTEDDPAEDFQHEVEEAHTQSNDLSIQLTPYRVYAVFKGLFDYSYPGTCVGVKGKNGNVLVIEFDNSGDVIEKDASEVRQLKLHKGDKIKIKMKGKGSSNIIWVVKGFLDRVTPHEIGKDSFNPDTDIFGHRSVKLEALSKQRSGTKDRSPAKPDTQVVPVALTYITHDLWSQFDDRQFHTVHPSTFGAAERPRNHSPPIAPSASGTPSSRKRRRTVINANETMSTVGIPLACATPQPSEEKTEGLFGSMAFAVTYSSAVEQDKASTIRFILQNGARMISESFEELFDVPTSLHLPNVDGSFDPAVAEDFRLSVSASSLGFVALITDTHSRRAKYVQALALNIPCLHWRWITDCLSAQAILPWQRYCLPAGESAYLGGAIRNRTFTNCDRAEDFRLVDTIATRPRLLGDANVVLVMGTGKKVEERRKAYLFLTYALGANMVLRVRDIGAAQEAIHETGNQWNWVYVDDALDKAKADLHNFKKETHWNKRTARKAPQTKAEDPDFSFKVVNDEYVVQSLILGALIET